MIAFIDDHRGAYGVEPICKVLPIAPSTYRERLAQRRDPARQSARARRDLALKPEIARVFAEHGRDGFLAAWLRLRGVDWAADLIPDLANLIPQPDKESQS